MSTAPQTLVDLRIFLAEQCKVPKKNFGIRGRVTARRPWGYHLGRSDIYGTGGKGDRDYSVRLRRDRRGLTNASAGFDGRLPRAQLKAIVAYLVKRARYGNTNPNGPSLLTEILGPDAQGNARRWARDTGWQPTAARADHEWHMHLSFYRDTEFIDKRPLFYDFFGITEADANDADDADESLEPEAGESLEPKPEPMPDPEPVEVQLADAEDAIETISDAVGAYYAEYPGSDTDDG